MPETMLPTMSAACSRTSLRHARSEKTHMIVRAGVHGCVRLTAQMEHFTGRQPATTPAVYSESHVLLTRFFDSNYAGKSLESMARRPLKAIST